MDTKPNSLLHNPTHNPIPLTHQTNINKILKPSMNNKQNHTGPNYVTYINTQYHQSYNTNQYTYN
jgi:hypothetical protein